MIDEVSLSTQIDAILSGKSIVEFLAARGHSPVREMGRGRFSYTCPLPGHAETKPSFVVYADSTPQSSWCYGCSRGGNIVKLLCHFEDISFSESLRRLSEGIIILPEDDARRILDRCWAKSYDEVAKVELADVLMDIACQCRNYLRGVAMDTEEVIAIDRLLSVADAKIIDCEHSYLEAMARNLPNLLLSRRQRFEQRRKAVGK